MTSALEEKEEKDSYTSVTASVNDENNIGNTTANNTNIECVELRNIKYKSMLLKKSNPKQLTKCNSNNDIDSFLEKERTQNKEDQWVKLDKSMKTKKINAFVDTYSTDHNLNDKDKASLQDFLLFCLEQKKLIKTKDVIYDKINGTITNIPCLLYTPTLTKKFTLKRCEKRQSTLSSLAPKNKGKKTTPSTGRTISKELTTVTVTNMTTTTI